jgi:hypothetical protein
VLQEHARKMGTDVGDLQLEYHVVPGQPEDSSGILLHGLAIVGALWDQQTNSMAKLGPSSSTINRLSTVANLSGRGSTDINNFKKIAV